MARVTGLGGIFFKAQDPSALRAWYREHLGLAADEHGSVTFAWRDGERPERTGQTVWALFPADTRYFEPSRAPFMINFRVDDLDGLLSQLRQAGVEVEGRVEEYDYGRFAWVTDPEGHRIELWEPPAGTAGMA